MKIKDLPVDGNLGGVRFIAPDGKKLYWVSQWNKGVWGKVKMTDTKLVPVFLDDLTEALEFEVIK